MDSHQAQLGGEMNQLGREQRHVGSEIAQDKEKLQNIMSQEGALEDMAKELQDQVGGATKRADVLGANLDNQFNTLNHAAKGLAKEGNEVADLTTRTQQVDAMAQETAKGVGRDKNEADHLQKEAAKVSHDSEKSDQEMGEVTRKTAELVVHEKDESEKMSGMTKRVFKGIEKMQMAQLSVPNSRSKQKMHDIEASQNSTSREIDQLNSQLESSSGAVAKEKEHNTALAEHEKKLEENEKKLASADEKIEENAKKAEGSIHMFTSVLILIVIVFGALHSTWRGKLADIEKKKIEAEKRRQEEEEEEYYEEEEEYYEEEYQEEEEHHEKKKGKK